MIYMYTHTHRCISTSERRWRYCFQYGSSFWRVCPSFSMNETYVNTYTQVYGNVIETWTNTFQICLKQKCFWMVCPSFNLDEIHVYTYEIHVYTYTQVYYKVIETLTLMFPIWIMLMTTLAFLRPNFFTWLSTDVSQYVFRYRIYLYIPVCL